MNLVVITVVCECMNLGPHIHTPTDLTHTRKVRERHERERGGGRSWKVEESVLRMGET